MTQFQLSDYDLAGIDLCLLCLWSFSGYDVFESQPGYAGGCSSLLYAGGWDDWNLKKKMLDPQP